MLKIGYDKFPITGKGHFDIHLINSCHVETVVLLSDKKIDGHINIDLDVEKLEDKSVASKRFETHKSEFEEI